MQNQINHLILLQTAHNDFSNGPPWSWSYNSSSYNYISVPITTQG